MANDLHLATPSLAFSPVESLESRMSLVSGVIDNPEIITDKKKSVKEKHYKDGRLEIWYGNGNR